MGYLMLFHELGLDYTWAPSSKGKFASLHERDGEETELQIYASQSWSKMDSRWECGPYVESYPSLHGLLERPADSWKNLLPITGTKSKREGRKSSYRNLLLILSKWEIEA